MKKYIIALLFILMASPAWAADWYVKGDTGNDTTGDGAAFATAYKTLNKAQTVASNGDTIYFSGGTSGLTYTPVEITKNITIIGSTAEGHSGTVTFDGYQNFNNTTGTATIQHVHYNNTVSGTYNVRCANSTTVVFTDVHFHNMNANNAGVYAVGGTQTFNRCKWYDIRNGTTDYKQAYLNLTAVSTSTFNYCYIGHATLGISILAGSTLTVKNSILNAGIELPNSATITVVVQNSYFPPNIKTYNPIQSYAANEGHVTASNNVWFKAAGEGGIITDQFDTANVITCTDCQNHVIPYFRNGRGGSGNVFIRVDDTNNSTAAVGYAAALNPEVKIAFYAYVETAQMTDTAIGNMRALIEAGNEVGSHARHNDSQDLSVMTLSAAGGSCSTATYTVDTTQAGDSSTWTGTLTLTTNGTPHAYDLAAAAYDTVGELVTAINGQVLDSCTITMAKSNSLMSTSGLSLQLPDTGATDIKAQKTLSYDATAFIIHEWTEAIADLQAYIRTGCDRNEANCASIGAAAVGSASASYEIRTASTPYGRGQAAVCNKWEADGQLWGGSACSSSTGANTNFHSAGAAVNMFTLPYYTMPANNTVFSMVVETANNLTVKIPLWHGTGPDSWPVIKAWLVEYGLGGMLPREWFNWVRTSGYWTISGQTAAFILTNTNTLMGNEDFRLKSASPLRDTGTDVSLTTDFAGKTVPKLSAPDIGIYEWYPASSMNVQLWLKQIKHK